MTHSNLTLPRSEARESLRRNQNTVRFKGGVGFGPVSNTVIIAIMLAVLGLIYLTQITKTSTFGYELNKLDNKKEALLTEKSDLEVESARLQALDRVEKSGVAASMKDPAQTEFVHTN